MRKKLVVSHLVAILIGGLMFGSFAFAYYGAIDVNFLPLKYYVNGDQKFPSSGQGGFIYNGMTYVQLRFLSESLGCDVTWRDADSSIHITSPGCGDNSKNITYGKYALTNNLYSEISDDLNASIKSEFGQNATIADWNEIKREYGNNIEDFVNSIGLTYKEDIWVTVDGNEYWSDGRHYIMTRHNGNLPSNYLSHDDIRSNYVNLGSWYGLKLRVLVKINN